MNLRRLFVLGLALSFAMGGCKRRHATTVDAGALTFGAAPPFTGPISVTWEQPYKMSIAGNPAGATFFATHESDKPPLKLEASFHDFPAGTRVSIGGEQGTTSDTGFWSTMLDVKPAVTKAALSDLKGPIELGLDLRIEAAGIPAVTTKVPKQDLKEGLRTALLAARDGGMTFGPNDHATTKVRGAAVVAGYSDLDFVGSAKNVEELDWVVIAENQKTPRATKTCSFKEGPATLKMFDADVRIVERRTGKTVRTEVLKTSDECPMFALVEKDDNSTKNTVMARDVTSFARASLPK